MKKLIVLAILMSLWGSSLVWADDLAIAGEMPLVKSSIEGVIKSVSWANPALGTKSEIAIKDAAGKLDHIIVTSTTTLWDADTKAIMPDKIVVRDQVKIIYITTPEGFKEALSVKIMK